MYSSEGEKVPLVNTISTSAAKGSVEKWLLEVQIAMFIAVKKVTSNSREAGLLIDVYIIVIMVNFICTLDMFKS